MKSMYRLTFLRALLLAFGVMVAAAHPALAQKVKAEGKFTLAHDVQWGSTVVPAGDYYFSLDSTAMPSLLTLHQSSGKVVAFIVPVALNRADYSENAKLVLTHDGEKSFVSSLYVGELGVVFQYSTKQTNTHSSERETLISMR